MVAKEVMLLVCNEIDNWRSGAPVGWEGLGRFCHFAAMFSLVNLKELI